MHRAMNADDPAFYAIPDDRDLVAQYFLAYSASASPTDFEEVVDYDFRQANVRAGLDVERASNASRVVEPLERYLEQHFDSGNRVRVSPAGWVNLGHHWRLDIARSQWLGIPAALFWHFTDFTYHTSLDRVEFIDPEELRRTGVAILATALCAADPRRQDLEHVCFGEGEGSSH